MKVALVYDRIVKFGGAERVLLALHQIWPKAPLFTAFYDDASAPWAREFRITSSALNSIPLANRHHELFASFTPFAFESFDFSDFDVVVSVTSAEAKGILTSPETLHICYLLTPTRYLWSHSNFYLNSTGNPFTKKITSFLASGLRSWDQLAAHRPDHLIAISNTVADRAKKYYQRQPDAVIYPPVDLFQTNLAKPIIPGKYFLLVSRLVPYKRVDLAVRAFNSLGLPLVIVGKGMQKSYLHQIAAKNVTILGAQSQSRLNNLYQHSQALIFPAEEDFGIVALEAQSAGKPVIAFHQGGVSETVIHGQTGLLFKTQSVAAIIRAVNQFNRTNFKPATAKRQAKKFTKSRFQRQFKKFVETKWQKHQKKFQ